MQGTLLHARQMRHHVAAVPRCALPESQSSSTAQHGAPGVHGFLVLDQGQLKHATRGLEGGLEAVQVHPQVVGVEEFVPAIAMSLTKGLQQPGRHTDQMQSELSGDTLKQFSSASGAAAPTSFALCLTQRSDR